jgi:hypothetical protein
MAPSLKFIEMLKTHNPHGAKNRSRSSAHKPQDQEKQVVENPKTP